MRGAEALPSLALRRARRYHPRASWLLLALGLFASSCDSKRSKPAPSTPATSGAGDHGGAAPSGSASHEDEHPGEPHSPPPMPMPPAASATSLSSDALGELTTLRISAHMGSVILRREGGIWMAAGPRACPVPARRIERALDNLRHLKAVPTNETLFEGTAFELQIVALRGEERLLHLDIADRNGSGDLVRLINDTTYRIQGLDRTLWSTNPAAWCVDP